MSTAQTTQERYLELEADATEAWNAYQQPMNNDERMRLYRKFENLASERDILRHSLKFVIRCESFTTTEPLSYEDAWETLRTIESCSSCWNKHEIIPV